MSDDKFRVIGEVKIGSLDETMRSEWDRLYRMETRINRMQREHEEALDAFWDALQRQYGHHLQEQHEVTQNFRISEDGDVFIEHCKCPSCQAVIHGMTVSQTVEEMYKNDLIPHQAIEFVRARAKHIDSSKEMRKKMMN